MIAPFSFVYCSALNDSAVKKPLASKKVTSKAKASNDADSRGKTAATIQQLKKKLAALGAEFEAKFPGVDLK